MRVLIADDHDLLRDTLALLLEREPDVTTAHAADLDGVVARIAEGGPFDLVLLDFGMPGMDGLEGLKRAMALNAGKPVALMSGVAPREVAEEALALGAAGFLPKTLPAKSLMNAVRFMVNGERFAPVQFMTARTEAPAERPGALSPREAQVLRLICDGQSNKEMARALALHESTVKLHVRTLSRKLGARNRTHAAMIARETGLA
jgi:DNA-binding NarL/FixJ family response regulator